MTDKMHSTDRLSSNAIVASIKRGLTDTRSSRVYPRDAMTKAARARLSVCGRTGRDIAPCDPGERPVVWAAAAHDTYIEIVRAIAETDVAAAAHVADRLDEAAKQLATSAMGRPGRLAFTYETRLAALPYTLAFEIVTWQKAGAVIAILNVVEDPHDPVGAEHPIDW